jgi:hypothetical protein
MQIPTTNPYQQIAKHKKRAQTALPPLRYNGPATYADHNQTQPDNRTTTPNTPPPNTQQTISNHDKNEIFGDSADIKRAGTTRLYFQNLNSMALSAGFQKWTTTVQCLEQLKCDIFGFAETCTNWKQPQTKSRALSTLRKEFDKVKLSTSNTTSNDRQPSRPRIRPH